MAVNTVTVGTLEYLVAEGIGVPHCFTTRLGGVSQGAVSWLNLGWNRGDTPENVTKNYQILADALSFDRSKLVLTRQTHSDIVRQVTAADARGLDNRQYPECDGLITNQPGCALAIFTADCTPILLWDPVTGAVGAAHAGWRGTAAKIAAKTAQAMIAAYGCRPENIHAAIGPNIAQCCFETDADVPEAMIGAYGAAAEPFISRKGEKYYVNLKEINALALKELGVCHIDISHECTVCQCHRFWSHRVTKGDRGTQGAIIVCKEVTA
jgi:YfiH family protein